MPDIVAPKPAPGAPIESAWGGEVHDSIEGIQTGVVNVTTTATLSTDGTFVFPRPFASNPVVAIALVLGTTQYLAGVSGLNGSQVTVRVFRRDGSNLSAGSVIPVHVVAVGTLA